MKKIIAFIGSWITYYIGHWTWLLNEKLDKEFLYKFYNWNMSSSYIIQEWTNISPKKNCKYFPWKYEKD